MKFSLSFTTLVLVLSTASSAGNGGKRPAPECDDKVPVCGEDGMTYDSECVAIRSGVGVLRNGHCPATHALKPKGAPVDGFVDGIPARFGRLDTADFAKDINEVKVLSFRGLPGKNVLKFNKKKMTIATSSNLVKNKERESEKAKEEGDERKLRELGQGTPSGLASKVGAKAWFGELQGANGKKGTSTANFVQDADGDIAGSVTDENGDMYMVQTMVDEDGSKYVSVTLIETKDISDIEGDGVGDGRRLLRGPGLDDLKMHRREQSASCQDVPGWHDSDGHYYDCELYGSDPSYYCSSWGDSYAFGGFTANQACCACGGGLRCEDRPGWFGGWYDSSGPSYNCAWYAVDPSRCDSRGDSYDNFGMTATEACCVCGGGGMATIDIMVAYTDKVMKAQGGENGIERLAALVVQETNVAFELSGVSARLRLVNTMRDPSGYDDTGKGATEILRELTNTGGQLDFHAARDQYGADLVLLLTAGTAGQGEASSIGNNIMTDLKGFAVVHWAAATTLFGGAHEIGHLLNAHHDRITHYWSGYNVGFFDASYDFRSIMSYGRPCNNCPIVQRFSNRIYEFENEPMGSATENNARAIESFAPLAAAFKPTKSSCNVQYKHWIGDGYCDRYGEYNTAECGWDGGDCCEQTCQSGPFGCTVQMECLDPQVTTGVSIVSAADGNYCLALGPFIEGETGSSADAIMLDCEGLSWDKSQKWIYFRASKQIRNVQTGYCLGYHTLPSTSYYYKRAYELFGAACGASFVYQQWEEGSDNMIKAVAGNFCIKASTTDVTVEQCGASNAVNQQEFLLPDRFFG